MSDQTKEATNSEAMDASQDASQAGATDPQLEPSQTETAEPSGPDHRAHVDKNYINPSMPVTLYERGARVYLKKARGLDGPFIITAVYSDRTYRLETEYGRLYKDGAKERDLQPL